MTYAYIEFLIPASCVEEICQSGDNSADVEAWADDTRIAGQLGVLSDEQAKNLAAAHGANDYEGHDDRQKNLEFILWAAAWNVFDEAEDERDIFNSDAGDRLTDGFPAHVPSYADPDETLYWVYIGE